MDQNDRFWSKYRWRFLRRNLEFQGDYSEVAADEGRVDYESKRRDFCTKWGIPPYLPVDPKKSFEELIYNSSTPNGSDRLEFIDAHGKKIFVDNSSIQKWELAFLKLGVIEMSDPAVTIGNLNGEPKRLRIDIDLSKVNSVSKLKKALNHAVDRNIEMNRTLSQKKKQGDPIAAAIDGDAIRDDLFNTREADFENILQIGDLKRQGLTNQEVARRLYPGDFKENSQNANPESRTRDISRKYARFERFVGGGYRKLRYP